MPILRFIPLVLFFFLDSAVVSADTIYVPDQYATIQAAIDASVHGDTLIVRDGTYVENLDFLGKAITVTSENGAASTVIDGSNPSQPGMGSVVIFDNGEGLDSVLDGFLLCNGSGTSYTPPYGSYYGGGIYCTGSPTIRNNIITGNHLLNNGSGGGISCYNCSPMIVDNTIRDNSAGEKGGGILCRSYSTPTITGNVIEDNRASFFSEFEQGGGGIACTFASHPVITNNIIRNNTSDNVPDTNADDGGGGIFCGHGSATITGNIISGNKALDECGGGIYVDGGPSNTVTISGNLITGNWAEDDDFRGDGGGICCQGPNLVVTDNIITANRSKPGILGEGGGGIYCSESDLIVIEGNIISGNTVIGDVGELVWGGGIYCIYPDELVTIENNFITGNTAYVGGGAFCGKGEGFANGQYLFLNNWVCNNSASFGGGVCTYWADLYFSNNTIKGNVAEHYGGGIFCSHNAKLMLVDSILWGNSAQTGPEAAVRNMEMPAELSIRYSVVEGGLGSIYSDPDCTLNWGVGMMEADPLFAAGADGYAYLRQAAAGQAGTSPCIDTGSDLASNVGMDTCWTRTDGAVDTGTVDIGFHFGAFSSSWTAPLYPDAYVVPEAGGSVDFYLDAGKEKANRNYILLGGVSGTEPGFTLPGGQTVLPVNFDLFTGSTLLPLINTYIFSNFMGTLDTNGQAAAQLNLPPIIGYAGVKMHYAFCLGWPWEYASNFVEIDVVP